MSSDSSDHSSPKPSKRKRVIISDSDSSDGSIVIRTHRRRRVYRVTSDSESSEEDSDVPKPVIRRKNYRVVSEDDASYESSDTEADGSNAAAISDSETSASDSQSDWRSGEESAMDEDEGEGEGAARKQKLSKGRKKSKSKVQEGSGEPGRTAPMDRDSDSSDGQADKCPICLLSFKKQQIATPESCDHSFCLDCLLEWSKNINTCPVDRQTFAMISVKKKFGGKVIKQLPVTIRPPVEEPIQEDATFCEICQECDREDRMLLCDGCDLGYHLECLTPPMTEVPMDEWFCPDCARNSQNDAEVVEIDLDELPDLMEEARRLGESYGRTRTGRERDAGLVARVIPRTRQTERVRANIRADRDRNRAVILSRDSVRTDPVSESVSYYDPDQPSTSSSGLDSVGNSVLGNAARASEITRRRRGTRAVAAVNRAPKATKRKRKSKKRRTTSGKSGETRVREVRITEINDEGEEEEFVTYVKVKDKSSNPRGTTGRRKTKRRKTKGTRKKRGKKRRARTVRSQAAKVATVKKRLAMALGMHKPIRNVPLLVPTVKNRQTVSDRSVLSSSRHHAGISQVSLFGNSHDLNYSPTGSDSESDSCTSYGGGGSGLLVSSRPRNAIASTRRHAALKTVQNPLLEEERAQSPPANAADLISSILNSQEFWHSKKNSDITLKADGTFFSIKNNNNNEENKHSINNNQSPIKENKKIEKINQEEETNIPTNETRLDLNNVGQNDLVQNPMYNSPRGGGNRGNFRGGGGGGNNYNCENNRHSYGGGGQYGGGRDSYGQGRHSYGGPRDFNSGGGRDFGPPMNFNQGFEMRGFGANTPPFRNRNPQQQNFRNERPPNRYPPPLLHSFNSQGPEGNNPPPFSPPQQNFQRFRPQLIPPLLSTPIRIPMRPNQQPFNDDLSFPPPGHSDAGMQRSHEDEECDLYSDIETPVAKTVEDSPPPQDQQEAGVLLPPPPEPPSGLLDFEESKSDRDCNDSDQELVIDDTPKEDSRKDGEKYDPFDNDSDSNERPAATQQPATQDFPLDFEPEMPQGLRLTAYDDDEDEDSQADCPNFSIYSSQTMDVARNSEQELSQQIGPLEPPPMPPDIPNDDDDIIVGDVQACDLADIPEPSDPYVESLQKERRTLSKIPPKKISSNDSRGKITFKIGNKLKLNNKLSNLYDELDENIENSIQQEKEVEEKKSKEIEEKKSKEIEEKKSKEIEEKKSKEIEEKKSKEVEEKKSKEVEEKKSKEVEEDPAPVLEAEKSDEDEEEEEKLEELEKQLKEKEQKLREMEEQEQEELDKLIEGEMEAKSKEIEQKEESATEEEKREENDEPETDKPVSTIDLTEKSSDSIISIADSVHSSPKTPAEKESADVSLESEEQEVGGWKEVDMGGEKVKDPETATKVLYDKVDEEFISRERDDDEDSKKSSKTPDLEDENDSVVKESEEVLEEAPSPAEKTEIETFPLEKDPTELFDGAAAGDNVNSNNWDSDGAYTPCKDELPVAKVARDSISPFESGLEPITPTKDKSNDDLDGCRTPAGYAGLGTEAISETDEPMSFEDELALLSLRREKEIEEGEIMEEHRLTKSDKAKSKEDDDKNRKKKKDKKEKGKESDKNKENISSQNQVAWKKISKSTKERHYRDKDRRSKSREKDKDKEKEKEKDRDRDRDRDRDKSKKKNSKDTASRKKEKRKELERYDVRKIVADKPSRPRKDEYGRDIRDESKSRSRSVSRRRSLSRERRSRSFSRNRQSRTRSRSRLRRSWSRGRRSYSKGARSVSRRKSLSRSRRKLSRRRSASRKRSVSRKRSPSKRRSRSPSVSRKRRSRGRSLSKNRRSRSRSRDNKKKEKITKKHKSRSRSRNRKRSRSKTPKRISSRSRDKKHTKRKRVSRSRERSRSREPRERTKNWEPVSEKPAVERERRSWSAQWTPSWSRSRTPSLPRHEEVVGWSPPAVLDSVPPKNLTVILTNKEAIKKKKKERKKEPKKAKDTERRKKSKRNRTPPPSKEVFASGDNILVSVCFNKENETNAELPEAPEATPLVTPTTKRLRRRENVQQTIEQPVLKRSKKDKTVKESKRAKLSPKNKKEKKKKSKAAEIAATKKPVAVIDLDQSPFREQTPSPRDVIVLSDDDDQKQPEELATPEQHVSPRASPIQHEQFVSQGPKTPPEPQIKFSINKQQNNLRASMINPLHEEEEEEIDERADEELEMRAQEELELRLKIGPNTPPEPPTSPPTSPDAYDPFDPTKSRSPTPAASQEATPADERDNSPRNRGEGGDELGMDLEEGDKSLSQEQQSQDNVKGGLVEKPKIISMVTIKRASPNKEEANVAGEAQETSQANESPSKNQGQQNQSQGNFGNAINPVLATVTAAVQRSGAVFNTGTPIGGQRNLLQANRISPINQNKQRSIDRPHLPNLFANPVKPGMGRGSKLSSAQGKNPASAMGQNGSDTGMEAAIDALDMSSPYSPGSSLSDGIFDPPSPGGHSPQQMPSQNANKSITPSKNSGGGGAGVGKTMDKKDSFDALFGTSPAVKGMGKNRQRKIPEKDKRKKSTNPKVGVRMDENQLQILDDLPSSAVEMQVKDKFLKKLNRQERVVEEVKLVLKPHYTKKHVTKEEYKDIMRKAVPKICHNKTGEINPKKIGQLVEAYVKKCRMNKKKGGIGLMAAKGLPKAAKNMWS